MKAARAQILFVTPEQAEEWLNHCMYERQRKRVEWQVKRLTIEIEKGRFLAGTQIHFGDLNGVKKLVNGQHTLAAIVRAGIPVQLTVLTTPLDREEQFGELYGRHDRHRSRTPHDAFLGMGLSQKLELGEHETNAFGSALKWVMSDFRSPSVHKNVEATTSLDYLAEKMLEWQDPAALYFECVREARYGMRAAFRRAPVVAVGLVTMRHQREIAEKFWAGAAQDSELTRTDPRRALNQFLSANTSGHGDPVRYIRHVAWAWNKFYENGELQFLRPGDEGKLGVTIRGTPYKAEKRKSPQAADRAPAQGSLGDVAGADSSHQASATI